MNPEDASHRGYEPGEARESLPERIEAIQRKLKVRDGKEAELLTFISQPEKRGKALTDAWLDCEIAQGDLERLVKIEIQGRLSSI